LSSAASANPHNDMTRHIEIRIIVFGGLFILDSSMQ